MPQERQKMTLEKIAKLGKVELSNENLEILSFYQAQIEQWLQSTEFQTSNWAKKPYPPLLNPSKVEYERLPENHAWTLNLPLPKNYDFVLFGSHAAGMHAAVPGFFTLCGVCVRSFSPRQQEVKNNESKGSFGAYCTFYKQLLAAKTVKEQGYTKKVYLQITNLLLDNDAKKFYSLIDASRAINIIRDPISVLRTLVTLPTLPEELLLEYEGSPVLGFLLCDDPDAFFKDIKFYTLTRNNKVFLENSPQIDCIADFLKDKEQVFHDGELYEYFSSSLDELYIKQTSDFAGGKGFETMGELANIFDFEKPRENDRWLYQKHVGEMKSLLPITLYANDENELYFTNPKKTKITDKLMKNSAKIILCDRFHVNNRLKPERDISELFALPDPLLAVFVDRPSDAVKLLKSPSLLEKTQKYIEKLSHAVLKKASELQANRKLFSESDILEYFATHDKERKLAAKLIKEHLKHQKQKVPHIIDSFKYYKEFEKMCKELDNTEL